MESNRTSLDGDHKPSSPPAENPDTKQHHDSGDHNNNNNNNNTQQVFHTQQLSGFASQLGAEQTREKLIPCLLTQCKSKHKEVKISFATEMGNFGPLVGGVDHVHCLFPILEILMADQVATVRENAIASLRRLSKDFTGEHVETRLYPLVAKLGCSPSTPSRASACGLIGFSYPLVGEDTREKLRKLFRKSTWDTPMVREQAADTLDQLAKIVEEEYLKKFMIIFKRFAFDAFVPVRVKVVKAGMSFASRLPTQHVQSNILPSIKIFAKDKSASVRLEVAKIMPRLQLAIGKTSSILHLVSIFQSLLGDPDISVREISSKQINTFCRRVGKRHQKEIILKTILPAVLKLVDDISAKVRSEVASVVLDLCPMVCKRDVNKFLWQIFLLLLGDSSNEVRISIISNLGGLKRFITVNQFDTHVIPFLKYLAANKTWRGRIEVTGCIYQIATKLGRKFFNDPLIDICIDFLIDPVYVIREEMGIVLANIVLLFGSYWSKEKLLKKVIFISKRDRYLHRLSSMSCLRHLATPCGVYVTTSVILPTLLTMAKDPVPNVRFNVAKTLQMIAHTVEESSLINRVVPALRNLSNDADFDVRFFADEALSVIIKLCRTPVVQGPNIIEVV